MGKFLKMTISIINKKFLKTNQILPLDKIQAKIN